MLLKPDCIPCILKMATSSIKKLTADEEVIKQLMTRVLQIPALRGLNWGITSPEAIETVMDIIMEEFHTLDPFRSLKQEQNAKALELYPKLKQLVEQSDDPLFCAVNLAIMGNSIDLMISDRSIDVENVLEQQLKDQVAEKHFRAFREKLGKAGSLLYLGDNAGEIVFDKVLIETINALYAPRVFFVVRGVPALNDVTITEALEVGMDRVATVISNGMKQPVPGTVLSRCSSELRELFQNCDLIISKGGGNFDSLEGEKDHFRKITFMLLAKCPPYSEYFKAQMYQPLLANFF
ncbi:conserved hypothetical protein [Syntrophobacter sp. SbD1]|nr:conserved hypothetical protein [Syntrophobacter sp. SbD1]